MQKHKPIMLTFDKIDFELLREQKNELLNVIDRDSGDDTVKFEDHILWGIVSLLDDLQDKSAEILGEEFVFGKELCMDS